MNNRNWFRLLRAVKFIILYVFPICAISAILYSICIRFFTIKYIEVTGEQVNISINSAKVTNNLLFFPSDSFETILGKEYPQIETINIHKKFPHTLVFDIHLRQPMAVLVTSNGQYIVDSLGYTVGYGMDTGSLPVLYVPDTYPNNKMKFENIHVSKLLLFLSRLGSEVPISEIRIESTKFYRAISGKTNIIIAQNSDVESAAATLQTIVRGFRMKGTMPVTVDLQYKKPIVIF